MIVFSMGRMETLLFKMFGLTISKRHLNISWSGFMAGLGALAKFIVRIFQWRE
jgi:hypothetical protein|tara:strand:- start:543 stop:701 length:159 start_codon:yes stop_codon:yes gene_type:complete